jgi:hypothetical protein
MPRIIEIHRQVLDGLVDSKDALNELQTLSNSSLIDGYWHGQPGIEAINKEHFQGAIA